MKKRDIKADLFASEGMDTRSFVKEATIPAPVKAVYAAWTDGETFAATYDPSREELSANIHLAIGGRYEWLWDGETGSNDCQVLCYIPNRMLAFSWNAPPDQPASRAMRTWVVVEFEAVDARTTRRRLTHLGFGRLAHWDETYRYFDAAWPRVLEQFRKAFAAAS